MKKYIFFKKLNTGSYWPEKNNFDDSFVLSNFLKSDCSDSWINWSKGQESLISCGNITTLLKEDDYIILYDLFDDDLSSFHIRLKQEVFEKLIDDWCAITQLNPSKIKVVWHEDGTISVEGE